MVISSNSKINTEELIFRTKTARTLTLKGRLGELENGLLKPLFLILTIITVNDIVSLDTPPKNDAAPIKANAPGSIHAQ